MTTLFANIALLPNGWAENVQIEIDPSGFIHRVDQQTRPGMGAETVAGPLIAGVANAHSHVWQRLIAGRTETRGDFWSWREQMYRYAHKLTPEQLHAVAAQAYVEMLKAGYTSVAEFHYLHNDEKGKTYASATEMSEQVIEAALAVGMRITHLPVLYQYANFGKKRPKAEQKRFVSSTKTFIEMLAGLQETYAPQNLVTIGWAPHSLRAVDAKAMTAVLGENIHPIHLHIAEQPKEVADCLSWCEQRPVAWLFDNFSVDNNWCLVHATHLQARELRAIAKSGATAVICPTTEANLADGIFQTEKYLDLEGALAIGSDSNISIDPAEELRWLEYGQRLTKGRRGILTTETETSVGVRLYRRIQRGGQKALGQGTGQILRGAPADLVVLDGSNPLLYGKKEHEILDTWIFSGGRDLVRDVMTNGKWQVQNGRHISESKVAVEFVKQLQDLP